MENHRKLLVMLLSANNVCCSLSKIKGKLKNVLLKKWRICVTLHPSCNGIFGDSGVFPPAFFGSEGRRQSDLHAFFLLFCPFWLFSGHLALWQGGKYGKIV